MRTGGGYQLKSGWLPGGLDSEGIHRLCGGRDWAPVSQAKKKRNAPMPNFKLQKFEFQKSNRNINDWPGIPDVTKTKSFPLAVL
jgi:hypothetical protein